MTTSYQKTGQATIYVGILTAIQFVIGLFILPILTKFLGEYSFGIWSQVNVTISLVLPFTGLGLIVALIRYLPSEKDNRIIQEGFYSILLTVLIASTAVSVIFFAFATPLAVNFFDGEVLIVRLTAAIIFISSIEPIFLNLLRTFQQIKKYSIIMAIEDTIRFAAIASLATSGQGILSIIIAVLAIKTITVIYLFFDVKTQIGLRMPDFSRIRGYLALGLPTIPRRMGFWLVSFCDRYIISFFMGITPVAVYSAASGLSNIPQSIVSVLTFVLIAPLSKLYDESRLDEVRNHISYSLKYFLALAIPFTFAATILAAPVLRLFATPQIASEGRWVVPILTLSVTLLGINNIIANILILVEKIKITAVSWGIAAFVNIALNIVLIPRLGILGAALTTLLAYIIVLIITIRYSRRELRFPVQWGFVMKSLAASVVMSVAVYFMAPDSFAGTIVTVITGVIIYSAAIILLRGFSRNEYLYFRNLFSRQDIIKDREKTE